MAKKIAIVSGIYPPDSGGPAKFAYDFGNWLGLNGISVSVISYSDSKQDVMSQSGVDICLIPRTSSLLTRYVRFLKIILRYKKLGYDFFAVGAFIEIYLAKILFGIEYTAKVPGDIVWERARNKKQTELGIIEFQKVSVGVKNKIFRNLYTLSLKAATNVIVPSAGLMQLCKSWGLKSHSLHLVYNSVDVKVFSFQNVLLPQYDVLTVCRLTLWKGVSELIELCSQLKLSLLIAGDGPERANLEKLSKSLGSKVEFLGNVPNKLMPEVYNKARFFVLNSEYEGLPHVLIEARAAGCLSIARTGTGSEEVIHHGEDGFLINSRLEMSAILEGTNHPDEKLARMIDLARVDTLSRFSQDKNFPSILHLLN